MRNRNHNGFTLMEIMVATGLIGIISLAVMQMNKTMFQGQATAEVKMETIEIKRQIITTLSNKRACEHTLKGINLGSDISSIKNSNDIEVFSVGSKYGDNALELEKIEIRDGQDLGGGMREGKLFVQFKNLKKSSLGPSEKSFETLIKVKASSGTAVIDECFADSTGVISTANQTTCLAIGGVWDSASNTCTISHFVKKSGDTMTGALTTPQLNTDGLTVNGPAQAITITGSNTITSPKFCTGSNCKGINQLALANQNCPGGQVAVGVQPNGKILCKALQCSSSQYFAGLDSSGNPICRPYPTNTCPTNEYVTEVKPDGTVKCAPVPVNTTVSCPTGQVIQSITAGVPNCVKNGLSKSLGQTCPSGSNVTGFNSDGSLICGTPPIGPINCQGSWSPCKAADPVCTSPYGHYYGGSCRHTSRTVSCPGNQAFSITQPNNKSGSPCSYSHGQTRSCSVNVVLPPDTSGCK